MPLPSSGQISLSQVNVELGNSSNAQISLGSSAVRALAERSSGSVGMSHLRGKSASLLDTTLSVGFSDVERTISVYQGPYVGWGPVATTTDFYELAGYDGMPGGYFDDNTSQSAGGAQYIFDQHADSFGSVGQSVFADAGGTNRTITYLVEDKSGRSGYELYFALLGNNLSNDSNRFDTLTVNGNTFSRSSATYLGNQGSSSLWAWTSGSAVLPTTAQSVALLIE